MVRRDDQVVLRGSVDLQSGPGGWRATVMVLRSFAIDALPEGRYEIELSSGVHGVRLDKVRAATREVRFVGIGAIPTEVIDDARVPRNPWRRRA
ncbi:MAG: hypothetical protein DWG75_01085 [Chloroflexi bacterium]|nr:hypothetical protein [Chloroflexota bacterium]